MRTYEISSFWAPQNLKLHRLRLAMKKVYLLFLLICFSSMCAQQGANGWTILDPAKADKVIYVSSSSGNDASGIIYTLPSSSIGGDPFLPPGSIKAFKSVEAVVSGIENGEAVWVLLKRGDVFYTDLPTRSGKSEDQPFLYSSYGNSSEPPLFKTGAESGVSHCCEALEHFWVVGLSFYAHTRDPDSSDYIGDAGDRGIYLETIRGRKLNNILLEGNVIRYYKDNVIQSFNGSGIVTNIKLRRNMILDGYNSSEPQRESIGLFVQNVDGLLLEENIFDHNGWLIPSYGTSEGADRSDGQATQYSHNTYFVDNQNVVFRNNSFNRPSSIANKWVASSQASTQNILIENNLYNDCEIGISMGTNYPEGSYRFKDIVINGNVMVDQGESNLTKRDLSWGIDIDDWDTGSFTNNILTSQNKFSRAGYGVGIAGETKNLTIASNIFYDLKDRRGVLLSDKGIYQNIQLRDNEFTYHDDFKRFIRLENDNFSELIFDGNTYSNANNILRPFFILNQDYELNEWSLLFPNEQASVQLPDYPDPSRDLDRYITEVLGLPNKQAYYAELRNQTIHNWRDAYTGDAIVGWIKNGFRFNPSGDDIPPVPNKTNLSDTIAECSVEFIDPPTAMDNISGSIQGAANRSFPITETATLLWYYTDEAGNTSSQEQKIIINDTEAPVLNVQNLPDLHGTCSFVITTIPTATDNCDGVVQGSPNLEVDSPITTTTIMRWNFADGSGNSISQTQKVVISETNSFVLDIGNLPDLTGDCSVEVIDIPTATFGCNNTVQGISDSDISEPITESTTINWNYSDRNGNSISQQQRIIVEDITAPIPNAIALPDLQGICSIEGIDFPSAFDDCDGSIVGVPNVQFPIFNEDIKEIVWTYVDSNYNSVSQIQKVSLSRTEICIQEEVAISDFEIEIFQETCTGVEDAAIAVKALKPMEYSAKISSTSGYDEVTFFNESLSLSNLPSGDYTICFSVTERDFELCETITLLPAEELAVVVQINDEDNKMFLGLSGSNQYSVTLNGVSNTVLDDKIILELQTGDNELIVEAENDCQDSFVTTIAISELATSSKKLSIYPNPVINGLLTISLKDLDYIPYQFNLITISGSVIKTFDDFSEDQGEVVIDVSELVQGTYILQGVLIDRIYTTRFIKI